jgi:GNAT superfamily N-acetyltransferase
VPTAHIRPFARADRDQLTSLVNANLSAVLPGASLSVQAVLSHLDVDPGEFIVDRWVTDRRTLVAEQDGRIVAATHLRRYGDGSEVGPSYRDAAEIAWLVFWPEAPFWAGSEEAGWAVLEGAVAQLTAWRVSRWHADGSFPVSGAYGVPDVWPHIRALYEPAGFSPGREEVVLACAVAELPSRLPHVWTITRRLGTSGVRFSAERNGRRLGYLEVDTSHDGSRFVSSAGRADIGNLFVEEGERRRGVATSLLAEAGRWLRLAGVTCLITYLDDTSPESERLFCERAGFEMLTRTARGWTRFPRQDD